MQGGAPPFSLSSFAQSVFLSLSSSFFPPESSPFRSRTTFSYREYTVENMYESSQKSRSPLSRHRLTHDISIEYIDLSSPITAETKLRRRNRKKGRKKMGEIKVSVAVYTFVELSIYIRAYTWHRYRYSVR